MGSLKLVRCVCNQSKGSSLVGILQKGRAINTSTALLEINICHSGSNCKQKIDIYQFFS